MEEEDPSWDLCWCDVTRVTRTLDVMDTQRRDLSRRIPHFRNHYELTRKNLLARNLMRLKSVATTQLLSTPLSATLFIYPNLLEDRKMN